MTERIKTLERLIPKLKANRKILPLKIECMEWELRALKAEQLVKNCSIPDVVQQRELLHKLLQNLADNDELFTDWTHDEIIDRFM